MGKTLTTALASKNINSAGQDLIVVLAEGNAAATRILEDVYAIAEHEKQDYHCSTTKHPELLFEALRLADITGARISDVYLNRCAGSAAHLVAALTVAAHPQHFADNYHVSACYYLGLCGPEVNPIPIHEFHAGVVAQLKITAGHADIRSSSVH